MIFTLIFKNEYYNKNNKNKNSKYKNYFGIVILKNRVKKKNIS